MENKVDFRQCFLSEAQRPGFHAGRQAFALRRDNLQTKLGLESKFGGKFRVDEAGLRAGVDQEAIRTVGSDVHVSEDGGGLGIDQTGKEEKQTSDDHAGFNCTMILSSENAADLSHREVRPM